ncbi:integral membrane protein, Sra family [Ancylostoma caninum]|uniref:Integral membrane protein, Sra family n=1 Tax=Ancylostoma caninum TaxID=29170 RepID=A0A368H456_ANCCA|nr:integral membrane protein, Sra family [Ancylostoma caninum]
MVSSALYTEPCDLSFKTSDCAIPTFVIMFCIAGMVICQNALWVDRFVATRFSRFHHRNCKRFGFSLCTLVITLSLMVPFVIFHNDPYNDRVLTCVMTPAGSATAVNLLFNAIVILNLAAITANIFIYLANQRMEKM